MKQFFLVFVVLVFMSEYIYAQLSIDVGPLFAIDYVKTPELPSYNSNGYGNQVSYRYGLISALSIKNRIKIGLGVEKYSRRECYECVYFPDQDDPPQRAYHPLINNLEYGCEYKTDTKIKFMEIPVSLSYKIWKLNKMSIFTEIGYSYQFILGREISMEHLQLDEISESEEDQSYLWSRESIRFSIGLSREISSQVELNTFMMYRSDSFDFNYQSIGIGFNILYRI